MLASDDTNGSIFPEFILDMTGLPTSLSLGVTLLFFRSRASMVAIQDGAGSTSSKGTEVIVFFSLERMENVWRGRMPLEIYTAQRLSPLSGHGQEGQEGAGTDWVPAG
jgi:hypothetical protein